MTNLETTMAMSLFYQKYLSRQNLRDMILNNYRSLGAINEHVPATRNLSPIQLFPHGCFFKAVSGCMQLEYSMKITVSDFGFIICWEYLHISEQPFPYISKKTILDLSFFLKYFIFIQALLCTKIMELQNRKTLVLLSHMIPNQLHKKAAGHINDWNFS